MPIYQTAEDLKTQREIGDRLESLWECAIVMSKDERDGVDALAKRRGRVFAVVEIKRKHKFSTAQIVFVDVHKVRALELAKMQHVDCAAYYVEQCDDALITLQISDEIKRECDIVKTGRKDRATNDVRSAYAVPIAMFERYPNVDPDVEEERFDVPATAGDYVSAEARVAAGNEARMLAAEADGTLDELRDVFAAIDARKEE